MIAKKYPSPDAAHADQTRKVDGMSELVAGMLLDDADATLPPPEASPGSLSAVRPVEQPRSSARPPVFTIEAPPPRANGARTVLVVLIIALALLAVVAAVLFTA